MPETIIKSKITTPRLHERIVHRERLALLLDENIDKNLIIISAPAGFGKTTLVLDYLSKRNFKHAWFSIPRRGIEDESTFFEYVISSVQNVNNSFGLNTLEVMKSYLQQPKLAKEMVRVLTSSFVNEFIKFFRDDVIFVIDDLHHIDSDRALKWLNELFNELLDNIPVNLHLLVMSRSIPDFNLSSLRAKRNLFTICEEEMNFDKNETARLLKEVYDYKFDVEDVKQLEDNLKGWITGIHLLLQAYGEDFNKTRFSGEIATENIFDFFAHEIYGNLNKELQEFLLVTSLIEHFDPQMCNEVLEIKNSRDLINEIVSKNLFIQQTRTHHEDRLEGLPLYNYHFLLRSFLNKKLLELKSGEEIRSLRKKIAEYYLGSGNSISAIDYFLEADEPERAVPLIIQGFEELYRQGRSSTLWRWLASISQQIINENPYLMYFFARLYYFVKPDYQKSLSYINNALKFLQLPKDEDLIVKCCDIKAMILFRLGKNESALTELKRLSNIKLKPENKGSILCSLAEFHGMLAQHEAAMNISNEAISILNKHNLNRINSRIYNVLALSYRAIGNLVKAQQCFEKALEAADNLYSRIMIISNIAIQHFHSGEFTEAMLYLDKANSLLGSQTSGDLFIHVLKCNGYLELLIGDYEKAAELLGDAYQLSEKGNDLVRMDECIMGLFFCYYYLNEREICLEYLEMGRINSNKYYKSIFDVCEAYLNESGPNSLIEKNLLSAYAYFHSNAVSVWEAEVSFCLTNYYLSRNLIGPALNYVKIFLEMVSANQYLGVFQNYILRLRLVFDFALSCPVLNQYKGTVKQMFAGVFNRLNLKWTSDEYKRKTKIQIETLYDIKMISFGGLQFVSRGNPVPESKWRKKKGKSILVYMMLKPESRLNKDKLIDIFFPDVNPETVEENFRQAVFNIRSVFRNPYLNIILYEGKMLYLNPDCYYNSDTLDFDKNYNIARSYEKNTDERIKACKEAIELYKGEFLEGFYEPWCEEIRNEYANKFISISELLLELLKEKEKFDELIDYSEKLLKHDKLNEQAYISLMEAYTKTNKTKTARRIYSKMLKAYKEELGEKPGHESLSRIRQLIEV